MTLRIGHSSEATMAQRQLRVSSDRMAVAMQRLSSGMRINSAADDAAGLGISERLRGEIRGLEQANRNIQDGISLLNMMDGALETVHSILHRGRELAVQFNNGTYDFAQKASLLLEMSALCDEIARIEDTTQYSGIQLLSNALATVTLQIGAQQGETMTISLVDLFGPGATLVDPLPFFALPWLVADVATFDAFINDVSQARTRIGSMTNRLEHTLSTNSMKIENLMAAESRIRDTDIAQEITTLTKMQVLQASGQTALLFANQSRRRVLDLVGAAS